MAIVLVVVAGGGIGIATWVVSSQQHEHDEAVALDASRVTNRLQRAVERTVAGLSGAPAIVDDSTVPVDRFEAFVTGILQVDPVIVAALELAVVPDERADFEARLGRPIVSDVDSQERAPDADVYYPVVAVFPDDDAAPVILGLDIGSDPVRGTAAGAARDTARAAVTPPVDLPYSPDRGIIVVQPLYRTGTDTDDVGERRGALVGFVSISYSIDALLSEALEPITMLRRVEVLDQAAADRVPLPAGWDERTIEFGEEVWVVRVLPEDSGSKSVALVIVAVSLIVAGLLIELIRRAWRYDRDLAASNERLGDLQTLTATLASAATVPDVARATIDQGLPLVGAVAGEMWVADEAGELAEMARAGSPATSGMVELSRELTADGSQLGELTVVMPESADPRSAEPMLDAVATLSGMAVARALRYDTEHQMVSALQAMLLPVLPPRWGPVELAAKYEPVLASSGVGGDWYDLLDTSDGPAVVIGDVVGKGVRAAGVMGQLRIATRTMSERDDPAAVICSLDALATEFRSAWMTSMAYVVIDVAHNRLKYGIAGHPPPLLLRRDRESFWLDAVIGPPLGVDGGDLERVTTTVETQDGDRLLLYTDGLVERRGEPIDAGLARLRDVAQELADLPAAEFLDQLVARLAPPGEQHDDIAVLCADLPD